MRNTQKIINYSEFFNRRLKDVKFMKDTIKNNLQEEPCKNNKIDDKVIS